MNNLDTKVINTWCPGCLNFGVLTAVKKALTNLETDNKLQTKNVVAVTGIGCHGKMYDYLNLNSFYALHGRSLPTMLGVKTGNPDLKVIGFVGDGDTYAEGIAHLIHNCRYNSDMTLVIHNNQTFALTTGQTTPISEKTEFRLNPLLLSLEAGATFVARGFAMNIDPLTQILTAAISHHGFSVVEVVMPCLAFHNNTDFLKEKVYQITDNQTDFEIARKLAQEWDYSNDDNDKIPLGIYYQSQRPVFEEQWQGINNHQPDFEKILTNFV